MHQIGKQEVGVELPGGWQIGIKIGGSGRVRQQGVVLQNQAQGQLRRKLPVPFAAYNVVIEDAAVAANRPQAFEQISILDLQRLDGTEGKRAGCRVVPRKKRTVERGSGGGAAPEV